MPMDAALAKFEQLLTRFEAGLNKSGGAASSGSADEVHPSVLEWDAFVNKNVAAFVAATKKLKLDKMGPIVEAAFKNGRNILEAASKCKKPATAPFQTFLKPLFANVADAQKLDGRDKTFGPHNLAIYEALQALNWLCIDQGPKATIEGQIDPTKVHTNKILVAAKTQQGADQTNNREFVSTLIAVLEGMRDYAMANFKMGLVWNAKGGDLDKFKPGASVAPAAAAETKAPAAAASTDDVVAAPPPPSEEDEAKFNASRAATQKSAAKGGGGGMSAVFSQINSAGDTAVTSAFKLHRVQDSEKAKNNKDKPVLEAKPKTSAASKTTAPKQEKKLPPRLEEQQGTWFCENYDGENVEVKEASMKENVLISRCRNMTVIVTEKVKSIQMENCFKVQLHFSAVVSTFEIVNSQRCTIFVGKQCPSVAIDKSNGINVSILKDAMKTPPNFVTSNISECNITVPGKTDNDDPQETPIPEQFITTVALHPQKGFPVLNTHSVSHGDKK